MNISLTDGMKDFIRNKVASGAFASEDAVLEEAVRRFREEDQNGCRAHDDDERTAVNLIDYEAIACCEREVEGKDVPSLEEVRRTLSKIPGSMAQAVIEERADRF